MHIYSLNKWQHSHNFTSVNPSSERKTLNVVILTAGMMALEVIAGMFSGSMALLADGWHMSTHAAALGITLFAYRYARRHTNDPRFTFGTGKISILGGFASANALLVIAIFTMLESVERLFLSRPILFGEAIFVAVLGLVVNLASVFLLGKGDHHHHAHDDHVHHHEHHHADHDHHHNQHHHEDHNLKGAYLHVLSDSLTSLLAIIALVAGRFLGWVWLDAVMGIVSGLVIVQWAVGFLRETGYILLDGHSDEKITTGIRSALEADADTRVADLHVWQITDHKAAAIISLVTHYPRPVSHYRNLLAGLPALAHVTIEINTCEDEPCLPEAIPATV